MRNDVTSRQTIPSLCMTGWRKERKAIPRTATPSMSKMEENIEIFALIEPPAAALLVGHVTIQICSARTGSPARTALPTAHFDRNERHVISRTGHKVGSHLRGDRVLRCAALELLSARRSALPAMAQ